MGSILLQRGLNIIFVFIFCENDTLKPLFLENTSTLHECHQSASAVNNAQTSCLRALLSLEHNSFWPHKYGMEWWAQKGAVGSGHSELGDRTLPAPRLGWTWVGGREPNLSTIDLGGREPTLYTLPWEYVSLWIGPNLYTANAVDMEPADFGYWISTGSRIVARAGH